uniref:protein FAM228B-like n=1 Tax=Ciona intestinalis TaxID=7719 RepID=UPI000180C64A|nr:protein FAM228B-like [Ciona intestinalis]|eukprot:XP_002129314.1 protein FAM228B-like [Ciona intestinalis]
MESSKLNQVSSGSIKFYSADVTELDLEKQNLKHKEYSFSLGGKSNRSGSRLNRASSNTSSAENSRNIKNWINQKSLHHIRDQHSAENNGTKQMYTVVLNNEENFVKGIDEFLIDHDLLNLRRKELLYKRWNERVYIPVRKRVEQEIERGFQPLDAAKRKEHRNYLKYTNKKGVVFLDTISHKEYDPLVLHGANSPVSLRVRTGRLKDPLLAAERERDEEEKMLLQCQTGRVFPDHHIRSRRLPPSPLVPLGRHGTECPHWLAMPLRDVESPVRMKSRNRMFGTFNDSFLDFDDWNGNKYGQDVVDSELRFQRKRRFDVPSTMPSPAILGLAEPTNHTETTKADVAEDKMTKSQVRFTLPPETRPQITA